ncbi:hypothetical protein BH09ACT2_BH09ACT2_21910 [soil metagenome]
MLTPRSLVRSVVIALVALALVGCTPERPVQVPSSAPTSATPSASPIAVSLAAIRITGTSLTLIGSDKSVLQQLSYSGDGTLAVAALSKQIGETPSIETLVATTCSNSQKRISWGDGLSVTYVTDAASAGSSFMVRSDSAKTPGGVAVTTASGFGVGDPIQSLISATPDVRVIGQDTAGQLGVEAFFDLDANDVGVVAISDPKTGLIRFLNAPVSVSQDC